jgi:hypothetical protein
MGSKTSKAKRPASVKAKTVVAPRTPQDLIDEVLDHLATDSDFKSLRSCALVSKSWVPSCRRHLFHTILFNSRSTARWVKTFPVPGESPAHYVRDLCFSLWGYSGAPQKVFDHVPWFINVEKMAWLGHGGFRSPWILSLGRLPQSLTSLTIETDPVTIVQIRDILAQLPNLDNLSLVGFRETVERRARSGMGTVPRGRFGGQLRLVNDYADKDVMDMLLEAPTGLHFTDVHVCGTHKNFLSAVSLAEACGNTLIRLSYTVSILGKYRPFFCPIRPVPVCGNDTADATPPP